MGSPLLPLPPDSTALSSLGLFCLFWLSDSHRCSQYTYWPPAVCSVTTAIHVPTVWVLVLWRCDSIVGSLWVPHLHTLNQEPDQNYPKTEQRPGH